MPDIHHSDQARPPAMGPVAVTHFASQVVSLLADRGVKTVADLREPLVQELMKASTSGTRQAFAALLAEMRRARISLPALADVYIPEAARRLGNFWLEDQMSWMDVSIGVGRMQSLLREIGVAWVADRAGDAGNGTVMLIIPDREQHTLGPMLAMSQMRRYGVSVCLRIAPSVEELRDLTMTRRFDGVLISVATKEKLGDAARTIKFLRAAMSTPCPIVIGGAVMSKVEDPASLAGGDFSSNDIGAALELIGLKIDASRVLRRA